MGLATELERRSKAALETLEQLGQKVQNGLIVVSQEGRKSSSLTTDNNYYVIKTDEADTETVKGTEAMRSLGGGVKAKLVKTPSGKYIIESFQFDRDRFSEDAVKTWLSKHESSITESLSRVQENMPKGSFADITIRVQKSLNMTDMFNGQYSYICYMFPTYCVVSVSDKYFHVPYSDAEGRITFGEPKEVEMEFVLKEATAYQEKQERNSKPNCDLSGAMTFKLKETTEDKREVVAVLIEAGTNFTKRRHYPKQTVQESTPLFAGLKMYLDHPTPTEEKEKPERSINDWLSTVVESWYEDGKAMGRIKIHDDWLWEQLKDPVFRENIGLSINASGKRYFSNIQGQNMEVIEQIIAPKSVDWVTEPGARGRVEYLLESQQRKEDATMLKTVKLEEVKAERPDLIESISKEVRESMVKEFEAKNETALAEALKPYKEAEEKAKVEARKKKVTEIAESSKLPKKAIASFCEKFLALNSSLKDEEVDAKVKEAIAAEVKYLNECGLAIKVGVDAQTTEVKETATGKPSEGFLTRIGVADKK